VIKRQKTVTRRARWHIADIRKAPISYLDILVPQFINNPAIPESIFDGHVFSKLSVILYLAPQKSIENEYKYEF
jgi:hypothetical protein